MMVSPYCIGEIQEVEDTDSQGMARIRSGLVMLNPCNLIPLPASLLRCGTISLLPIAVCRMPTRPNRSAKSLRSSIESVDPQMGMNLSNDKSLTPSLHDSLYALPS